MRGTPRFLILAVAAILALPPMAVDAARVRDLRRMSGETPFPRGCGVPGEQTPHSEAEPSIAVDPRDPRNIIVTWQQDRFAVDGGALSNLVAVSRDGGRSWRRRYLPGLSRCTGGIDERASDPWVSIGLDGTAYLASLTFSETPINPYIAGPTKLVVSTSRDHGLTWGPPVDVQPFDVTYNDREAVTADPTAAGFAYYAFVKRLGAFGESGVEQFSRTTDGGKTWSVPRTIFAPPIGTLTDPTLITVLPDGTLLNLVLVANLSPFLPSALPRVPWFVMATRSKDRGITWSPPVVVASMKPAAPVDPDSGAIVRAYNVISADVAPDGTAYVVWNEIMSPRSAAVYLSKSSDGGETWSSPRPVVRVPSQAFIPSVAVDGRGTVGVTYDDFRRDRPGDGKLSTDVWFSSSRDGGRTWQEIHVAGPFDILSAPESESSGVAGLFVGDYQALDGLPRGFIAAFAATRPTSRFGPSDIFVARLDG